MSTQTENLIELEPLSFDDFDHMVEWSKEIGWDNIGSQLTRGDNRICFDSFSFPELVVGHYCVQQSIHNVFALPEGVVLFLICRTKQPLSWCGRHLPPTLLGIARSGLEHEVVLRSGWDCYEFMVSEDLIQRTEFFPLDFFKNTTRLERAFVPLMEPVTGRFLQQMDAFFQQARGVNGSPGSAVHAARFFDFIINGLQQVVDSGLEASGSLKLKSARRPDLVRKTQDFVSHRLHTELSVDELAQSLGVSNRVLHYAFKDTLGISPGQYLINQKLHAVRRLLKTGDYSVTEASQLYAFNTPSRFARQYERHFGELPSETRRQYQGRVG